jgi:hypothetical protein
MKKLLNAVRIFGAITGLLGGTATYASMITYHTERAVLGGTGCSQQNASLFVNDFGDLEIHMDGMFMALTSENTLTADRKSCAIRVPITIPKGYYVRSIEQRLAYAISKSAGAQASLATRTSIGGLTVNPFTVYLPRGDEIYSENLIDSRRDFLGTTANIATQCSAGNPEDRMLQINMAASGQRDNLDEELSIYTGGAYLGEDFEIELAECPQ